MNKPLTGLEMSPPITFFDFLVNDYPVIIRSDAKLALLGKEIVPSISTWGASNFQVSNLIWVNANQKDKSISGLTG